MAAILALGLGAPALAAGVLTVTGVSAGPALGKVAAAATASGGGDTVFTIASSGAISVSGHGGRIATGTSVVTVTVKCTSANCTAGGNGKITAIGTPTGRARSLTHFTVGAGTITPSNIAGTATSTTTFDLPQSLNKNASETFQVGMDFPIGDDASGGTSGAATSSFLIQVAEGSATPSGSTTGTATATVYRGLAVTTSSNLMFGAIVRPVSGTGTVTVDNTTGAVSVTGSGTFHLPQSGSNRAAFSIAGEGSESFTLSVPGSIIMTSGANSLTVTTTSTVANGSHSFTGSAGNPSTFPVAVGGAFPIAANTPMGAYTGNLAITAAYN